MKPKIAILLPCYNEREHVCKVVNDWKKAVPDAEVWFCDNNSTDGSFEEAWKIPGIHILQESVHGKGAAVKKLLSECHADVYIMCDVDDTYEATSRILEPLINGKHGMAVGDRLSSQYFAGRSGILNRIGNGIAPLLCRIFLNADIRDPVSGLRAFTDDFIREVRLSDGFEIETEMNIAATNHSTEIFNIPIEFHDRDKNAEAKAKFNVFSDGMKIFYLLAREKFGRKNSEREAVNEQKRCVS